MNQISPFSSALLTNLFSESCDYTNVTLWIKEGKLNTLSDSDRLFLLNFITRNGMLHAIAYKSPEYLMPLVDAGIDINSLDIEGNSLLSKISEPNIFIKMLD